MNILSINRYKNRRFPIEIISHAVWLYFRFCLSYRDVEELLFARGIIVIYEAIRQYARCWSETSSLIGTGRHRLGPLSTGATRARLMRPRSWSRRVPSSR
jgi:hypothetical protein